MLRNSLGNHATHLVAPCKRGVKNPGLTMGYCVARSLFIQLFVQLLDQHSHNFKLQNVKKPLVYAVIGHFI